MSATIYAQTMANGGGTFEPLGHPILTNMGYVVAARVHGAGPTFRTVHASDVEGFYEAILDLYRMDPDVRIGTWLDGNVIHIDPVVVVQTFDQALAMAHANNQRAIYDLATKTTRYVG